MEKLKRNETLIDAMLLASAMGSMFGVMIASKKGSKARKRFAKHGDEVTNAFERKFRRFLKEAKLEIGKVKDKSNKSTEHRGAVKAGQLEVS